MVYARSQKFDRDNKGFITAEDLKAFCTEMAMSIPHEVTPDELIAAGKPAKDGQLTEDEFAALFKVLFPPKARSKAGGAGGRK